MIENIGNKSKIYKNKCKKNNSISMRIEDSDKWISNKTIKYYPGFINYKYISQKGSIPKSKNPLSSKNQSSKNSKTIFNKKNSQKEKSNNNSSINIRRNYNE